MVALAAVCIVIGVVPVLAVTPVLRVGASIGGIGADAAREAGATLGPALRWISLMALGLAATVGAGWWLRRLLLRRRPPVWTETWGCGYARPTPRMQYTAASFAAPLVVAFGSVAGVHVTREPGHFHTHATDVVLDRVVFPLWTTVRTWALTVRPMQQGRLWLYLLYLLGALLVLLLYLAFRAGGPGS